MYDDQVRQAYEQGILAHCKWVEGGRELLQCLKNQGKNIIIVTDGFLHIQSYHYEKFFLEQFVQYMIVAQEVGFLKPDIRIFQEELQRIPKSDKRNTLMVGDSLSSDYQGALNAGLDFCWYNPFKKQLPQSFKQQPTFQVSSWREIISPSCEG